MRTDGPLTVVVREEMPSGTLLGEMVLLPVPESAPASGLLAVTGATDPPTVVVACMSAPQAVAIATRAPTAHTLANAATQTVTDALDMMHPLPR